MGNQLAPHRSIHKHIDELQNAVPEKTLGGGRLLQTKLFKHDVGQLVVKVYNKQGESLDLKPYKQQLKNIHDRLKCLQKPHVWPFQEFVETENTGFMIRPYIFQNLYDRICARPFLIHIEKCWITYQLLEALEQCHSNGVCHGDIKSQNALVTSWNWVFLTDFASYKPTYLPADNPADFSYFFDITGERRCYVAPERFLVESDLKTKPQGGLTPAMDIFSLGCVIAELFLEGKALFDFSELHSYRKGQFQPQTKLTQIDPEVQKLILHMIQLDPSSRWTSSEYLTAFKPSIFPVYFSKAMGPFFATLLFEDSDVRLAMLNRQFKTLKDQIKNNPTNETFSFEQEPSQPRLLKKFSSVRSTQHQAVYNQENGCGEPFVTPHPGGNDLLEKIEGLQKSISFAKQSFALINDATSPSVISPSPDRAQSLSDWTKMPGTDKETNVKATMVREVIVGDDKNNGMLLLLVLLCSSLRCPKLLETKKTAMRLLAEMAESLSVECCLNRVLPYILEKLSDDDGSVRALALHFMLKILTSLRGRPITNYERRLYQDYILPALSLLPSDPEEIVRVEYAAGVAELTACATDYLRQETSSKMGGGSVAQQKHDRVLAVLRERIIRVIQELVSGEKSSTKTRCALALSVTQLSNFYGNKRIPELLLILTTFMNDTHAELRVSFFECVQGIDAKILCRSYQLLQPLFERGFIDECDTVVAAAVSLAKHICTWTNTKKDIILSMSRAVAPLMNHRSSAVRSRVIQFFIAVSSVLSPADSFARLLPLLELTLPQDPFILDSEDLVSDALHASRSSEKTRSKPKSRATSRSSLQKGNGADHSKADSHYVLKIATYSIRVDSRMIQCGLSRHEASLEEVSKRDTYTRLINSSRERDVRNRSVLLTRELYRTSVKHGNLETNGNGNYMAVDSGQSQARHAMTDAILTGMDDRSQSQMLEAWKPEGVLLAHYVEHRRCVNQIAVSTDKSNPFFVTASNDGTVKVWDLKRVQDDVSFQSCATYAAQKGEILSITCCDDQQSIASASSHGSVHVWRINYAPQASNGETPHRFAGISSRREVAPEEGAILHIQQWDALLLYTSQRGILHAWDVRMKRDAWSITVDPKEGLIRHVATDPLNGGTWFLTGSSQGVLDLWDVRFKMKVAKWKHPSRNAIVDVAPTRTSPDQLRTMGIKTQGPFVYIAAGGNEVGLWDIHDQSCRQVFRAIPREETEIKKMELPSALSPPSAARHDNSCAESVAAAEYCTQQLNRPPTIQEGICTLLPIGEGSLVTGGHDKYIRVWDGLDPKHSFPMCGPMPQYPHSEPRVRCSICHLQLQSMLCDIQGTYNNGYDFQYSRHFERDIPIIDECCLPSHSEQSMRDIASVSQNSSHVDCITDLATAHVHDRLLMSASRDGIVKIWK